MCAFLAPQVLSLVVLSVPILCLSELCPSLWSERSRQDEEEDKVQQRHPMVWPRVMSVVFLVMPWQRGITNPFPVLSTFSLISHCITAEPYVSPYHIHFPDSTFSLYHWRRMKYDITEHFRIGGGEKMNLFSHFARVPPPSSNFARKEAGMCQRFSESSEWIEG